MCLNIGRKGGVYEKVLVSHRVIFRIAVSTPSSDNVNYPAESSGRTDPRKACYDQPNYTDNNSSVINLSESRN